MDKLANSGILSDEDVLRYKQKRGAGFFDTKLKVQQSTEYFESLTKNKGAK